MYSLLSRNIFFLLALMWGAAGCSNSHMVAQQMTDLAGRHSPLSSYSIDRKRNFILPMGSVVYVMRPSGRVAHIPADAEAAIKEAQATVEMQTAQQLSLLFAKVQTSRSLESVTAGLTNAERTSANFMILPRLIKWPSAKPVYYRECKAAAEPSDCEYKMQAGNALSDDVEMLITFSIFDVSNGALIDHIGVKMHAGITSYLSVDYEERLVEMVERVMSRLVHS